MNRVPRWAWFWPGLPDVWMHGSAPGLALALAAAALLNLFIVSRFFWTELPGLGPKIQPWFAATLSIAWVFAVIRGAATFRPASKEVVVHGRDLFPQAMAEYLKGNWIDTQQLLRKLLVADPADVDARMMLVGALRRSGQPQAALQELAETGKFDRAAKWEWEMGQVREQLQARLSDESGEMRKEDLNQQERMAA